MGTKKWNWKPYIILLITCSVLLSIGLWTFKKYNISYTLNKYYHVGKPVDSLHGVLVYYNGAVGHVSGRNVAPDGYNIGLKYQCVEFVKRYYYEHFSHKMPDVYGHAKDFFDKKIADGKMNKKRNLIQYTNPSQTMPKVGDLLIFDATPYNKYGHVAIISAVTENDIEIIQQNPGPYCNSRDYFLLIKVGQSWKIKDEYALGWLRKE